MKLDNSIVVALFFFSGVGSSAGVLSAGEGEFEVGDVVGPCSSEFVGDSPLGDEAAGLPLILSSPLGLWGVILGVVDGVIPDDAGEDIIGEMDRASEALSLAVGEDVSGALEVDGEGVGSSATTI